MCIYIYKFVITLQDQRVYSAFASPAPPVEEGDATGPDASSSSTSTTTSTTTSSSATSHKSPLDDVFPRIEAPNIDLSRL